MKHYRVITNPLFFLLLSVSMLGMILMLLSVTDFQITDDTIIDLGKHRLVKRQLENNKSIYEIVESSQTEDLDASSNGKSDEINRLLQRKKPSTSEISGLRGDSSTVDPLTSGQAESPTSSKWKLAQNSSSVQGDFIVSKSFTLVKATEVLQKTQETKSEHPKNFENLDNASRDVHNELTEPQQLKVWVTYNDEQFRVYQRLVKDFENQHKVEISISRIPFQGQGEKIMYACNSRRAPDIARMDIGLIPKFAAGKALMALDDLGLKEFSSELLDAALDAGRVFLPGIGSRSYAVPDEFTTLALYYNKEMFTNAGLNPNKPPESWQEFIEYAKKLTKDLDADGKPEQYGFAMQITPWWSMPFLFSFDGNVLDEKTMRCKLGEKGAINALKFQVSLSTEHKIEGGAWRSGAITPAMGFKNKIYAMILNGPWNLRSFRDADLQFGVGLIPGNPSLGIRSKTNVGGNANVIFRSTKSPKLAMKFLRYLSSAKVQSIWMEELGAIPINKKAHTMALQKNTVDTELLKFMEQAEYAESRPKIPGYDKIDRIITNEVETAFSGDRTPEEAMLKACETIEDTVLKELKLN
ncbi:MAG: ABC transporter substrate-binding protein [bacterium]|nr:ABC transporter substrate-binding protein [bacterium]